MHVGDSESSSALFHDEDPAMHRRRRPVPRTQMGTPRLRTGDAKRRPVLEWMKAILLCIVLVVVFLSVVSRKRSRHFLRKSANFGTMDRCDISTDNKFERIPEVIGKLDNLKVISLKGNLLEELSTVNLPTSSLVWLITTNNNIRTIDPNIAELKHLRKLMLSHNNIESIPVELGSCKELELVRLANNQINAVPDEVLRLPKLAWISISGNPVSKPPSHVAKVIPKSDIEVQSKVLGKGASGTVYQAKYEGKDVAVKMFKGGKGGSDGTAEDEAAINGLIDHPLAISAIGVIPGEDGAFNGMVMKLLDGTFPLGKVPSFDTVTRDEGPAPHSENLTGEQVLSVVWNIASVLEYIHSSVGVSHGDVYLHNVLRDGTMLSDWGASFVYDREKAESAAMYERIEVLAFGHLVQDLYAWHLGSALDSSPLNDLTSSILQPDQSKRPDFATIKGKLAAMPEFAALG
ncbi:LOW QUALITY PROTEIN: hypothetical protein ACHAXT_010294 [Thalassiosira profunda]